MLFKKVEWKDLLGTAYGLNWNYVISTFVLEFAMTPDSIQHFAVTKGIELYKIYYAINENRKSQSFILSFFIFSPLLLSFSHTNKSIIN